MDFSNSKKGVINLTSASRIVEDAGIYDLFDHPQHPYTEGLLASTPSVEQTSTRLSTIPGAMLGQPAITVGGYEGVVV